MLKKVDVNSDGEVDFFEFIALIAEQLRMISDPSKTNTNDK
jgi:Ca2+-binding EF-hand superfamily protein